jgi:DNA-binding CsgD family transcriptional regulator/tetratricopeptide (TPR) repeat protein
MTATSLSDGEIPIVGRQRELTLLWHAVLRAKDGRLAVALLTGEPGIGKSRLLDTAAAQAMDAGAAVLRGGAFDAEGMPPYLPFLEALGQHVRQTSPDNLRAQVGPLASVLATILPELPARLGAVSETYALPPEQARLRLYEAVATLLAAIAEKQPLLLILDDLQWADPASLDLLHYVARRLLASRVCILGAFRSGEVAHGPEFERTLAALEHLRVLHTIALDPLARDELASMATHVLQSPVAREAAAALHTQSEGNPFFAEELLRDWRATGAIARRNDRWELSSDAVPAGTSSPPSIARLIRQRLGRLPLDVLELLRSAAIIGRSFEASLLAEAVGTGPDDVEARLRVAADAQLLRVGVADRFAFSHDKIRESLYDEVTPTRRQRLHGFVGQALERQSGPVDSQRLADLAFHFARSGDRARGAGYARQAADHALRAFAAEEAMAHVETALRLSDGDDPLRGELLLSRGEAAVLAGAEREAVVAFASAQNWFRERGDAPQAARAARLLGEAWWRQEEIAKARAAFETALTLLEAAPGPEFIRLLVDLGSLLAVSAHQQASAIAHVRRAVRLAQELADDQLLAVANRALGNLLARGNDLEAGIPLLEQALALASAADDSIEAAECCACLALAYFWQGSLGRSEEAALRRLEFAEASHDRYQLRHVYTWLAVCRSMRGDFSEADRRLDQAQAVVEGLESPEPRAYLAFCRGATALTRGDYGAAEAQLGEAMAVFRTIGAHALVWYLGFYGVLQVAQGKTTEARRCLAELEALLDGLPQEAIAAAAPLAYATQVALFLDDQTCLERFAPRLSRHQGQFHDFLIDRLLAEIETRNGNVALAAGFLDAAEALARRENIEWELPRTLEARADLARADGGAEADRRERALLEEALVIIEQWGNEHEARRLRARLDRVALTRQPSLPAGLSPREAEVLRLVALGRSNRAIADELSLSAKTIENHLTNVYGKLGVDNRAAATAFAVRHDLA